MQPSLFNKACRVPSVKLETKDKQLAAIQHVYNGKDMFVWQLMDAASSLLHMYEFLPFVFVPHIHFGRQDLQATVLHGDNLQSYILRYYFYRIFLCISICEF